MNYRPLGRTRWQVSEIGLEAWAIGGHWGQAADTDSLAALRWIVTFDPVSCAIPGAKRPSQAADNVAAAGLPPLSEETMAAVREVSDRHIRPHAHHRW